jgi:hypothetical protein
MNGDAGGSPFIHPDEAETASAASLTMTGGAPPAGLYLNTQGEQKRQLSSLDAKPCLYRLFCRKLRCQRPSKAVQWNCMFACHFNWDEMHENRPFSCE